MRKELFDDAIGEVPPSTVDVDAAITLGRRAARLRKAGPVAAVVLAVVLASGAVAYTMTGRGEPTRVGTPASTSSSPVTGTEEQPATTRIPVPPAACSRSDLETAAELNARLTALAQDAVTGLRPGMRIEDHPVQQHGALVFFQVNATPGTDQPICGDAYSMATAVTRTSAGAGNISILVGPYFYDQDTLECDGVTAGQTYCEVVTGVSGDRVMKSTAVHEGGTTSNRVDVVRRDGTSVVVTAEDIDSSIKTGGVPTASSPPLDHDQLAAIATLPGMTLFP